MSEETAALQPDVGEVLQEEAPEYRLTTVEVCVTDVRVPVRVQLLPTKAGGTRTRTIGSTAPVQVLTADHRRANMILCSFDQDFLFAFSEASAQDPSTMSRQPKGVPLTLTATADLYVMAQTATTALSITTQRWASGGG